MAKRTYSLNEPNNNAPSKCGILFKPCVGMLLAFIAICVLILLMKTIWTKDAPAENVKGEKPQSLGSQGHDASTTKTTEIFVTKNAPTEPTTQDNTIRNTSPSIPEISSAKSEKATETSTATTKYSTEKPYISTITEENTTNKRKNTPIFPITTTETFKTVTTTARGVISTIIDSTLKPIKSTTSLPNTTILKSERDDETTSPPSSNTSRPRKTSIVPTTPTAAATTRSIIDTIASTANTTTIQPERDDPTTLSPSSNTSKARKNSTVSTIPTAAATTTRIMATIASTTNTTTLQAERDDETTSPPSSNINPHRKIATVSTTPTAAPTSVATARRIIAIIASTANTTLQTERDNVTTLSPPSGTTIQRTNKDTLQGYEDLGNKIDLTTENAEETTAQPKPTIIRETSLIFKENGTNGTLSSSTTSSEPNRAGTTIPSNVLSVQSTRMGTSTETARKITTEKTMKINSTATTEIAKDTSTEKLRPIATTEIAEDTSTDIVLAFEPRMAVTTDEIMTQTEGVPFLVVTTTETVAKSRSTTQITKNSTLTELRTETIMETTVETPEEEDRRDSTTESPEEATTLPIAAINKSTTNTTTTIKNLFTTEIFNVNHIENSSSTVSTFDLANYDVAEASVGAYDESTEDYSSEEITETTINKTSSEQPPMKGLTPKILSTDNLTTTEANYVNIQTTKKNKIIENSPSGSEKTKTILIKKPEPICQSAECKSASSRMLSLMDHSINPCSDFYEFSCGGMQTDSVDLFTWKRISEQLYSIKKSSPLYLQTLKTFYNSCVSYEYNFNYQVRVDSVLKLVQEVGAIVNENTPNNTIDITQLFINLILRQSHPFMDVDVEVDNETSKFILKLTPPRPTSILKESGHWSALTETQKRCLDEQRHKLEQLNLDLTEIYESYLTCQKNHTIYLNSIETVVQTLGFYSHLNNTFNEIQQIRTTIEWDILDIINILPSPSIIKQEALFKDYEIMNISELQRQYPMVEWKKLFSKITRRNLDANTKIHVYFSTYFKNTFEKLQNIHKWKINNAFITLYANNLYENLVIPQAKHTRANYCLKLSSKLFHDLSSNLYIRAWPQDQIKGFQKFVKQIFDRLKQNLTSDLQEEKWLDAESKTSAILKLKNLKLIMNNQEDIYNNDVYLQHKYKSAVMTKDFQDNVMKMIKINRKMRFGLVGETFSTDYLWSYFINVYDNLPSSFYSQGLIMAPLGMVKHPVKGLPGYITMAQIGLSLAKEIGRHFDPIGIQNKMSLSQGSHSSYKYLESVMENESLFNTTKFLLHHRISFAADPKLSVNERIADNTAFRLISDSFEDFGDQTLLPWVSTSFSREQIFYITTAQEFCQKTDEFEFMQQLLESETLPAPLRVENMVRNSKQFSTAFFCPLDAPMSNNHKRMQFPHLLEQDILL